MPSMIPSAASPGAARSRMIVLVLMLVAAMSFIALPADAVSQNFSTGGCTVKVTATESSGDAFSAVRDENTLCGSLKLRMVFDGGYESATPWEGTNYLSLRDSRGNMCKARGAFGAPDGNHYVTNYVVFNASNC